MDSEKLFGEFLRARREGTTPAQVGLTHIGPRRTPGLRREEVAMLAGVSTDYYIRLEQGRERHPSERVLNALVRVLGLGPDAATHLYRLAELRPRHRTVGQSEYVSPNLLRLMRSWPYTPALVCGRWLDVLAGNPLATALYDGLEYADNLLHLVFLDPAASEFYPDWEHVARCRVAQLRAAAGADLDDPHLNDMVGELSYKSPEFRRMWARHEVASLGGGPRRLRHREVGDLVLTGEVFNVNSSPGQQLLILQAEPGSPSAHSLALLGSLAAMTP
jgi:transcriptional regulator with XRE-family HTH domain